MKLGTTRLLIIIFIALTLFVSLFIPAGQPHYRIRERIAAMKAYSLNPSATTQAAIDAEFARLHHHEKMVGLVVTPLVLALDVLVVYLFWNNGARKTPPYGVIRQTPPLK